MIMMCSPWQTESMSGSNAFVQKSLQQAAGTFCVSSALSQDTWTEVGLPQPLSYTNKSQCGSIEAARWHKGLESINQFRSSSFLAAGPINSGQIPKPAHCLYITRKLNSMRSNHIPLLKEIKTKNSIGKAQVLLYVVWIIMIKTMCPAFVSGNSGIPGGCHYGIIPVLLLKTTSM